MQEVCREAQTNLCWSLLFSLDTVLCLRWGLSRSRQNKYIKTKFSLNYAFGMEAVQIHLLPAQWPSSTSCKGIIIIPLLFFFSFTGLSCVCEWANLFHSFFMLCPLAEKKTLVEKFRDQRKKERKNSMNGKTWKSVLLKKGFDVWTFFRVVWFIVFLC